MARVVEVDRTSVPAVCRFLRTKQTLAYGVEGDAIPWEAGENAAAAYWCLATSAPVGPDDALVHPHHCLGARGCYRARE
jgi:hypothetical protein